MGNGVPAAVAHLEARKQTKPITVPTPYHVIVSEQLICAVPWLNAFIVIAHNIEMQLHFSWWWHIVWQDNIVKHELRHKKKRPKQYSFILHTILHHRSQGAMERFANIKWTRMLFQREWKWLGYWFSTLILLYSTVRLFKLYTTYLRFTPICWMYAPSFQSKVLVCANFHCD